REQQIGERGQRERSEDARPAVVLAKVEQLAFDLQRGYLAARCRHGAVRSGTLAADVNHRSLGEVVHAQACSLDAPAVVDLFRVEEVARVEKADFVDGS